jgi:hypothetical protein
MLIFMKIRPIGAEGCFMRTEGQTDEQTERQRVMTKLLGFLHTDFRKKNIKILIFIKIHPIEAEGCFMRTEGQTDEQTERQRFMTKLLGFSIQIFEKKY